MQSIIVDDSPTVISVRKHVAVPTILQAQMSGLYIYVPALLLLDQKGRVEIRQSGKELGNTPS